MKRGEVWWVNLPAPAGRRPAVLVSRNQAYNVRGSVTVVPLSRTSRGIPTEVPLGPEDGAPKPCVANADDVTTVARERVQEYVSLLSPRTTEALDAAIKFALELS